MKIRLPLSLLLACACAPAVSYAAAVVPSATPTPTTVFDDKLVGKQWQWFPAKNGVEIAPLWAKGITGSGVVIGIIDSWVEPNHEDLNVSPYNPGDDPYDGRGLSKDFVGTEAIPEDGSQIYTTENHGMFVAGMAGAIGGNGTGVVGAAPGATIAGLHSDLSTASTMAAAYWASGVSADGNWTGEALISVKNCSFGSGFGANSVGAQNFLKSVEQTSKNNVIYVFAAGNSRAGATDGSFMPSSTGWSTYGNSTSIINVAATKTDGTYADFSCYGSNIFISAPGQDVVSTDRTGTLGYNDVTSLSSSSSDSESGTTSSIRNNNYAESDGTSFASPLVAGVVALGKQVCSVMDVRWAKHALAYSSGYGEAPNIDCVKNDAGEWVQKSNTTSATTTDPDTGETTTGTRVPTGDWQRNNGGYWFNNNYGFGMVNPVGFVDVVRDIAYTTVETTATIESSKVSLTTSTVSDLTGARSAVYSFSTMTESSDPDASPVQSLSQRVETVSVTIDLSTEIGAADANADFTDTLKITLVAPDGKESVLVEPGQQPDGNMAQSGIGDSWTFETNAFWGSDYSSSSGNWQVKIEYTGTTGNTDLLSVSSVDFTMGAFVTESGIGGVSSEVNAHALALDNSDSVFTIFGGGKFLVEDAVLINDGTFMVASGGEVGFYADSALSGKTGAVFIQNGGTSLIEGTAEFLRGFYINAGESKIVGGEVSAGASGVVVNGGSLSVAPGSGLSTSVSFDVSLNGGSLELQNGVSFEGGVTQKGGSFTATAGTSGNTLTMTGGTATFENEVTFSGAVKVGAKEETTDAETGEVTDTRLYGGVLNVAGRKVSAMSGVSVAGAGAVFVSAGSTLDTRREGSVPESVDSSGVKVADSGYFEMGASSVLLGDLNLSGGNASLKGENRIYGASVTGGSLSAAGTLYSGGIGIGSTGTFRAVGRTTFKANVSAPTSMMTADPGNPSVSDDGVAHAGTGGSSYFYSDLTLSDGAVLVLGARSRADRDVLVIGGESPASGTGAVTERYTSRLVFGEDADVTIRYSFGDLLPFETSVIEVEKEYKKDQNGDYELDGEGNRIEIQKVLGWNDAVVNVPAIEGVQVYDDDLRLTALALSAVYDEANGVISLKSGLGEEMRVAHLHYAYQTPLQNAVQLALLRNAASSESFLETLDGMSYASELLAAYDELGTPTNLVAIDELHDKQAAAVTGALSRRSRELRSGFIHSDTWSNPLFGSSGFSFSARPNLVAAKGFVPYMIPEDDYPLMLWMNGAYSFSEADDAGTTLTSTKSNMLSLFMGVDYAVSREFAVGLFAGYTGGRTKFEDGGRTEIQSRNVGVYLTGAKTSSFGSLYYTALAAFGFEEYDFSRKISVGALSSTAKASPDGWQGIVSLEGGYEWKLDKFSMGPNLSLRYVSNNVDGYTESSSDAWARQETDDVSYDSLQSSIGWRIAYRADFETVSLLPEVRVSWNHEFIGTDESFDARLAMAGADFYSCEINSTGDDFATVGAGLTVMLGEVTTVSFDYDVQFLRDDADPVHTIGAMLRTRF